MLGTLTKLKIVPDVLFVSGQGVAHPRGLGIASHLGVVAGLATIGIAKKPLFGLFQAPSMEAGSVSAITHPDDGSVIGFVVRAKTNVKPLYVSPGHRMDAETPFLSRFSASKRRNCPFPFTWQIGLPIGSRRRSKGQRGLTPLNAWSQTPSNMCWLKTLDLTFLTQELASKTGLRLKGLPKLGDQPF